MKLSFLPFVAIAFATGAALQSCDDSVTEAGLTLVEDEIQIINDSTFTVTATSDANNSVRCHTILQLLGRLSAEGYGDFSSDIVCQYMPAAAIDTAGVTIDDIDSVKLLLTMYSGGFVGDSVAPMGLTVYPLTKQLPSVLTSSFDPEGYYDPSTPLASTAYSAVINGYDNTSGTDSEGSVYKHIIVDLPLEIGQKLYQLYIDSPETLATPQAFAKWFPGLYIANSFGSGRVTRISSNAINVYYHGTYHIDDEGNPRDTVVAHVGSYMAVTPEVLTNNNIAYSMAPSLKAMVRGGESILVGPLGYDVEFTFPAREILRRYQEQAGDLAIVNSLTFQLPASEITNNYGITPPPYILMVKKSEKSKFFSALNVNDNLSSFYATYDSKTGCYNFSSMLNYINEIIKKGYVEADDEEFVICPVNVSYYTSSSSNSSYYSYYYGYSTSSTTISSISAYVTEPVMAKLDFGKAKITFSFSKQTL